MYVTLPDLSVLLTYLTVATVASGPAALLSHGNSSEMQSLGPAAYLQRPDLHFSNSSWYFMGMLTPGSPALEGCFRGCELRHHMPLEE